MMMRKACAYFNQEGKYSIFEYGEMKISFLMDENIQYRKVLEWDNGLLTVESLTKNGIDEQKIDISVILSDLGYDAKSIIPSIGEVKLSFGDIIPDYYYSMYRRKGDRYQVSCPRGSVLFNENGVKLASGLPYVMEDEARSFFAKEQKELEKRRNNMHLDLHWVDRMPDCSTSDYAFFRDGEVYYSVMKVFPADWCIHTAGGSVVATEMTHSETYGSEWSFKRCMKLAGNIADNEFTEREKKILEIGHYSRVVKFGIAFYVEESYVRAIPVGWIDEYAIFDESGNVIESTMKEHREERARIAYSKVEEIWLHREKK